jgi:hypothetical protein
MTHESVQPAAGNGGHQRRGLVVTDWKPFEKNTLRGFLTIITPSGLRLKECTFHEREGKRWISLPAKQWAKTDGSISYSPLVDFVNENVRNNFQQQALAALDDLLDSRGTAA